MKIIRRPEVMVAWSENLRRQGVTIGFVPTMGALHEGHRSLIRAGRRRSDALVVSVFVNPTQFGPTEDFARYPRVLDRDHALCRTEGVDVCFEPTVEAMYPKGYQTVVMVSEITRRWEGERRPHHFQGVATVVTKLFRIVQPHFAVFGQKDYQQVLLVRRLVQDLNLGVKIIICPTVREPDGLAMSSRNIYLSEQERTIAPLLYKSLKAGSEAIRKGVIEAALVQSTMAAVLKQEPRFTIEYLAVCDPLTLEPLTLVTSKAILLGAVRLGSVRLIDNLIVSPARNQRAKRLSSA
ncbi:MAG: pantoate--beta-alanine ligase [Nitrospira sp.]|nr:pantoate--beta-alanine ligase [Nitrospira sp.]